MTKPAVKNSTCLPSNRENLCVDELQERHLNGFRFPTSHRNCLRVETTFDQTGDGKFGVTASLNIKCIHLNFEERHQRNSNGYIRVFGIHLYPMAVVRILHHQIGTSNSRMAPIKSEMHLSHLADKLARRFQRIDICFFGDGQVNEADTNHVPPKRK